jgi:hypothetical protein
MNSANSEQIINLQSEIKQLENKLHNLHAQLYEAKKNFPTKVLCYSCRSENCTHLCAQNSEKKQT